MVLLEIIKVKSNSSVSARCPLWDMGKPWDIRTYVTEINFPIRSPFYSNKFSQPTTGILSTQSELSNNDTRIKIITKRLNSKLLTSLETSILL